MREPWRHSLASHGKAGVASRRPDVARQGSAGPSSIPGTPRAGCHSRPRVLGIATSPDHIRSQESADGGLSHALSSVAGVGRTASEQGTRRPAGELVGSGDARSPALERWTESRRQRPKGLMLPLRSVENMTGVQIQDSAPEPASAADVLAGRPTAERAANGHSGAAADDLCQFSGAPTQAIAVLDGDPGTLDVEGLGRFLRAAQVVRSWVDAREAAALAVGVRQDAARQAAATVSYGTSSSSTRVMSDVLRGQRLWRRRSSKVSMSAGSPGQVTSRTISGWRRMSWRAPSSPSSGSSGQTAASSFTGGRL